MLTGRSWRGGLSAAFFWMHPLDYKAIGMDGPFDDS